MKISLSIAALLGASAVLGQQICGQFDELTTSNHYIIFNNLWGESAATSGSQCTTLNSASGSSVAWSTEWTWVGGPFNVKSFANANLVFTPKQISAIKSIPTTMDYTYTGSSMVADVAYDLFTASTAGASASNFEIMIWLAALGGAGPISSTGSPVATPTLAGHTFNLFDGFNGAMHVYSFVAQSQITAFSGDILTFLDFLISDFELTSSQFLNTVQAGTEPFTGSNAVLTVSDFSAAVN